MTPMIDVVFNLIIFFLLSSHLARQEVQLRLDLPAAATGNRPGQTSGPRRVVLQILPNGEVTLGGRAVAAARLTTALADEQARSPGEIEVRIRADRRVPYRHVEPILRSCAGLGIWNVTFAVVRDVE
jgi:biopolymer transport protein ExbD